MATEFEPYVGPRPYERDDKVLLYGRDQEADQLLSLIVSYREVLFCAQSGTGKTSLLNAKVIPMLEELGFEVLPLARVQGVIPSNVHPDEIRNIYIFNTLVGWAGDSVHSQQFAQMSLTEFLKARPRSIDEEGLPSSPRAIIFDQFEELFALYPHRWSDRRGFFEQVRDALNDDDHFLRVVFTMREDNIAQLDPFASLLSEKLRIRFRLEHLRREAALLAVTGPLKATRLSFAPGVAEKLVEDLLKTKAETETGETVEVVGEFVEPVQLQVICQNLWQEMPQNATQITEQHLLAFGDLNRPLSKFYESAISAAAKQTNIDENALRQWCQQWLITSTGTRGIVHRDPQKTKDIPNEALDILAAKHLIRLEWRSGAHWYELTHDRFIVPIRASNERWNKQREEKAKDALLLLRQVELRKSRSRIKLLSIALIALVILGISGGFLYATRFNPAQQGTLQAQAKTAGQNFLTARAQAKTADQNFLIAQAQATANFLTAQAALAQVQAIYNQALSGNPALYDPLSRNDANNWDEGFSVEGGDCTFTGGVYHASIVKQNTVQECLAKGTNFSNFAFQVQMTIIKGDGGGLIFRARGLNSSYRFRIGSDGTYDFFIPSTGIHPIFSTSNPAIKMGSNLLTVIASGNTIFLFVNGQYLNIVSDSTYSSGEIGLFAFDSGNPTDVAFSNAKVWNL